MPCFFPRRDVLKVPLRAGAHSPLRVLTQAPELWPPGGGPASLKGRFHLPHISPASPVALLRVLCALEEGTVGFAGQSLGSEETLP